MKLRTNYDKPLEIDEIRITRNGGSNFVIEVKYTTSLAWYRIFDETSGKLDRITIQPDKVEISAKKIISQYRERAL